ncbi:hypothetical protein Tco_1233611 [Tanacetum coccineum]
MTKSYCPFHKPEIFPVFLPPQTSLDSASTSFDKAACLYPNHNTEPSLSKLPYFLLAGIPSFIPSIYIKSRPNVKSSVPITEFRSSSAQHQLVSVHTGPLYITYCGCEYAIKAFLSEIKLVRFVIFGLCQSSRSDFVAVGTSSRCSNSEVDAGPASSEPSVVKKKTGLQIRYCMRKNLRKEVGVASVIRGLKKGGGGGTFVVKLDVISGIAVVC